MMNHTGDGTGLSQISAVTEWTRLHGAEAIRIEALAELAGMSVTTLHRHFKTVTRMSPLQYRTQIRLQEARPTLLAEGLDAGEAGFNVGYESPSQFGREYRSCSACRWPPISHGCAARHRRVARHRPGEICSGRRVITLACRPVEA